MIRYQELLERGWLRAGVGLLLVLLGLILLVVTERSLIGQQTAGQRHGGQLIDLGTDASPQGGEHGFMARVSGTPVVVEAPLDKDFNLQASTPVLIRHVEMFQWREIRVGGSVHYEMDWADRPIDAARFQRPSGHVNPDQFPLQGKQFDAGLVRLGGFKLSSALQRALPGSVSVSPQMQSLPANLAASFSEYNDYLVTSAHPGSPRVGDLRVSWQGIPLQLVTVVARVNGGQLEAATGAADGTGYSVSVGDVPLLDVYPDLPLPPTLVLLKRILAVLLAVLGMFLLLPMRGTKPDMWLAPALGVLVTGAVATVLWLSVGTNAVGWWLAFAVLGLSGTLWRVRGWRQ